MLFLLQPLRFLEFGGVSCLADGEGDFLLQFIDD